MANDALPALTARLTEQLGRHEIIARLGQGGMAQVFLAVQRGPFASNKLVVIKKLLPGAGAAPLMHLRCSAFVGICLQFSSAVLCASQRATFCALVQSRGLGGVNFPAGAARCMHARQSSSVLSRHASISFLSDSQRAWSFHLEQSMGYGLFTGASPDGIAPAVVAKAAAASAASNTEREGFIGCPSKDRANAALARALLRKPGQGADPIYARTPAPV